MRPLFDALYDTMDPEKLNTFMERGTIEVAPLAFMRGRTLNDSFVILDEAQNTSPEQMQMFLTRLGFGSKMVVTGDVTQIDLPREQASGLIQVRQHPLVGRRDRVRRVLRTRTSCGTSSCSGSSRRTRRTPSRPGRSARGDPRPVIRVDVDNRTGDEVDEAGAVALAQRVLAGEGLESGELGLAFVGPEESRALKSEHLGIDEATDALAFPMDGLDELPDGLPRQLGDVVDVPGTSSARSG